jgi:starch synthase
MHILMVSAEMAPLVKVGGLGDVVGALAGALAGRGHEVHVVLPLYGHLDRQEAGLRRDGELSTLPMRVGQRMVSVRYWRWPHTPDRVTVHLVNCDALFGRAGVYAGEDGVVFPDTVERLSCLCQAALALPEQLSWPVDVVHAHDVHAALAVVYRRRWYAGEQLPGAGATLLTLHNLAHQEIHPAAAVETAGLPLDQVTYPGIFEFFGQFNLLKGGILDADMVSTVSPTYAREVVSDPAFGCGLEGVLASRGSAFVGILNGVDDATWNPRLDPHLPARYDADDLAGKAVCKEALLSRLGLDKGSRPLLGLVARLVSQKGLDLLVPLLDRLVAGGFSLAVLGAGEARYEEALRQASVRYPGRIAFAVGYDEPLSHLIYAGADLFLMPSRFEPCGLSQMYALRYGTPPVVRRTGGLADTVSDAVRADGTGFMFDDFGTEPFWGALEHARAAYSDPIAFARLQRRGMARDFSWEAAAAQYEDVYARLAGRRRVKV